MFTNILSFLFLASTFSQASPLAAPVRYNLHKRNPSVAYGAGGFELMAQDTPIIALDNGVLVLFQIGDSNFVVYDGGVVQWDSQVGEPAGCTTNECFLTFQSDGNLVSYFNGVPTWDTETGGGRGAWLVFFDTEPYIVIYDAAYYPAWHTPSTPPALPPKPVQQGLPCQEFSGDDCNASLIDDVSPPIFETGYDWE